MTDFITSDASLMVVADWRNGYIDVARAVVDNGRMVDSQHGQTLELRNATIVLTNPCDAVPSGIGRGYSPALVALESCMLVGGFMDDELITSLIPSMRAFTEDNGRFWGSYGLRLKKQLPLLFEKLKNDPDTRQAVVTLWDPKLDGPGGKKDHPCTIMMQFMVRDGELLMHTYMRSNDILWGAAHDFAQFTCLQLTLANLLGLDPGPYVHTAGSLHVYTTRRDAATGEFKESGDLDRINDLTHTDDSVTPTLLQGLGKTGMTWQQVARQAKDVVYREGPSNRWGKTAKWYNEQINKKRSSASG